MILEEAQQFLRQNWDKGAICPCCNQFVKIYHRKLTSSMAYGLFLISRYFANPEHEEYLHVENYLKDLKIPSSIHGDFSKMKYWGLIERSVGTRVDGSKRNGHYKITEKGNQFIRNEVQVARYCKLYNNKFYGLSEETTSFKQALGDKFDYDELMNL